MTPERAQTILNESARRRGTGEVYSLDEAARLAEFLAVVVGLVLAAVAADDPPLAGREWLSVGDVARLTGQRPETVQDKARRGLIPMFKDGREWKMTPQAFDAWEARYTADRLSREARYPARRGG